jgi:hypothetical protein
MSIIVLIQDVASFEIPAQIDIDRTLHQPARLCHKLSVSEIPLAGAFQPVKISIDHSSIITFDKRIQISLNL